MGQFLYCKSKTCGSRLYSLVKVWIEKLGILNWGESLISSLTSGDDPQVKSLKDLYLLDVDDIAKHCSGYKHAVKCYDTLHANKEISLDLFMSALNIESLGIATANDIISSGRVTVEEIFGMTEADFSNVQNVGKILAQKLSAGLSDRKNEAMNLLSVVSIVKSEGNLFGKSFCITGATSKPRKSVEKDILNSGGLVKSSVSQGLSFLVTNETDTTSSKMMKAKKLSIPVISEQELYEMM